MRKIVEQVTTLEESRKSVKESGDDEGGGNGGRVVLEAAESAIASLDEEYFAAGVAGDEEIVAVLVERDADRAEAAWGRQVTVAKYRARGGRRRRMEARRTVEARSMSVSRDE